MPTGVIFGCMLLDCEEILQEWQQWRTINEVYLNENQRYEIPQAPLKAFAGLLLRCTNRTGAAERQSTVAPRAS